MTLPPGYFVTYGGQFENQQRAMRRLALIVPVVLLLIAGSCTRASATCAGAARMLNVPFALVGGIAALWLRGAQPQPERSVGFIALFGVAVLNGWCCSPTSSSCAQAGPALRDAVREGAAVRPARADDRAGGERRLHPDGDLDERGRGGAAAAGDGGDRGAVSSTILTLLVLPALYEWLEERWPAWTGWVRRRRP